MVKKFKVILPWCKFFKINFWHHRRRLASRETNTPHLQFQIICLMALWFPTCSSFSFTRCLEFSKGCPNSEKTNRGNRLAWNKHLARVRARVWCYLCSFLALCEMVVILPKMAARLATSLLATSLSLLGRCEQMACDRFPPQPRVAAHASRRGASALPLSCRATPGTGTSRVPVLNAV